MESISTTTDIDRRYPRRAFLQYENVIVKREPADKGIDEVGQDNGYLDTELTWGEWADAQ